MKDGKESTEWTVVKWVMAICGIVGAALTSVLAALAASGTLESNSTLAVVLTSVAGVLVAVGGVVGKEYVKGRSVVKASAEIKEDPTEG